MVTKKVQKNKIKLMNLHSRKMNEISKKLLTLETGFAIIQLLAVKIWGISSAGRAPRLHRGGQEFDPPMLHHIESKELERVLFLFNNKLYAIINYRRMRK